jgi:hypothetical protein
MSIAETDEMESESGVCPICGESNNATHLYKIYSDLLNGSYTQEVLSLSTKQLTIMVSPPMIGKNEGLSSLHPDLLVIILFIIFVYLFAIQLAQKGLYTIIYGSGIGFLLFVYWIFRQKLVAKYTQNKFYREKLISELRAKVDIWMVMVYCKKDDLVFTPDHKVQLKLDQLREYWISPEIVQG